MNLNGKQVRELAERCEVGRLKARQRAKQVSPEGSDSHVGQCHAATRRAGERCSIKALSNGYCRRHGGVTKEEKLEVIRQRLLQEHRRIWARARRLP